MNRELYASCEEEGEICAPVSSSASNEQTADAPSGVSRAIASLLSPSAAESIPSCAKASTAVKDACRRVDALSSAAER